MAAGKNLNRKIFECARFYIWLLEFSSKVKLWTSHFLLKSWNWKLLFNLNTHKKY